MRGSTAVTVRRVQQHESEEWSDGERGRTPASHLVLGTLVIVLLLIISSLAKNAYREQPAAAGMAAPHVRQTTQVNQPTPPPQEPVAAPLEGGVM